MSNIEVTKFKAEDVSQINKQDHDVAVIGGLDVESYRLAESQRYSYTIAIDGKVVACVGAVEFWKNRGEVWAIIDRNCGDHFLKIVRVMKRILDMADINRLEAAVLQSFKQGHRLALILGFDLEAPMMRKYGVNGLNYSLYARIK